MSSRSESKEIPSELYDNKTNTYYKKGRFLGKGGFAKCYEITDGRSGAIFAGKIVPKTLLKKQNQKDKMSQEIDLHRKISHKHVVKFYSFFEDKDFVYVVLELCRRRSLMELHKRRKAVTEPEARYYMHQIALGVKYLHNNKIIHRDLKLGNLFLTDEMEIKIGDLGLATRVNQEGERKKTLCGTPNYIAPEVLCKKGHSYEVDIWSLGCIMYTLLVGKPPFETSSLKETYTKIKRIDYHVPSYVSDMASVLIKKMLRGDPSRRPNIEEVLEDDFFHFGYMPSKLPTSCLTVQPRFHPELLQSVQRKPLSDLNHKEKQASGKHDKEEHIENNESPDYHMGNLMIQLLSLRESKKKFDTFSDEQLIKGTDEAEDPAAHPVLWIGKWVDYTDKYGLGYQLCDNSNGVLFNDCTRLVLHSDNNQVEYIDKENIESFYTLDEYPKILNKKITLLQYFRSYMTEHLLKAGADMVKKEGDELARLPYLRTWFRTRSAIVLHLSNGTLQINFFNDHAKIILEPLMGAVTYIAPDKKFRTFRISKLEEHGCVRHLYERLDFARKMLEKLITSRSASATNRVKVTN